MTPPAIVLNGDALPNRLFASNVMLDQIYYRYLDGEGDGDILYGGYGIVSLTGGLGADKFIVGATPGGTGTTDYTAITDYNPAQGDSIVLSGGLTPEDVVVRAVTAEDLPFLNNLFDPDRIIAAVGDSVIVSKATGQALVVLKSTAPGDIEFTPIGDLELTAEEEALLAPPTGGTIAIQDFLPTAPPFGPRIVEYADYDDLSANYISSGVYTTLAGAGDTLNKFVSFDFSDPPAPYGTYLNARVGPLQHTHNNELELFFVVSGTYIFTEGMQDGVDAGVLEDHVLTAGTLGYGPLGRVHGFRAVPGDGPGRIFSFALPSGLDKFFDNVGTPVTNRFDQITPNSQQEAARVAFWAEQRGDQVFLEPWDLTQFNPETEDAWSNLRPDYTGPALDGRSLPTFAPQWPDMVTTSIDSKDRPTSVGAFGEQRLSLVTADEAKAVTGRVAWKGPFSLPSEPGATFVYDYITLDPGVNEDYSKTALVEEAPHDPRDPTPSSFTILYSLEGPLSIRLYDQFDTNNPLVPIDLTFELAALTFLQLPTGTRYSLANTGASQAKALSINIFNQIPPAETQLSISSLDDTSGAPDDLVLTGDPTFAVVEFSLEDRGDNSIPMQIAVFSVNDKDQILCGCDDHGGSAHDEHGDHAHDEPSDEHGGMAHYVSPGDPEYLKEALKHSKVIMTVLDKSSFQPIGTSSILTNFSTVRQEFVVVQGSTVADSLAALEAGLTLPPNQVAIGDAAVSLTQNGESVDIRFGNNGSRQALLRATPKDITNLLDPPPLGPFNWNYSQQQFGLLDLTYDINATSLKGYNIDVTTAGLGGRRGSRKYVYGFYQLDDENGSVVDPVTGERITATAENRTAYLQAAVKIAQSTATGFLVKAAQADGFATKLEGGYLYAPLLMPKGTKKINKALVAFSDINPNGKSAEVMIGTNQWAWEVGKGQAQYDDFSFSLEAMSPFAQRGMGPVG